VMRVLPKPSTSHFGSTCQRNECVERYVDGATGRLLWVVSEARRNYLSVRCVPFSAPYDANLSVSFGDNRRSELNFQSRESALNGPWINRSVN
jgi:hypothetical protein